MARDPVAQLMALCAEATADGFAAVMDDDFGARLCEAVGAVEAGVAEADAPPWAALRASAEGFVGLGRHDRSVLIATAMRLGMTEGARRADAAPAATKRAKRASRKAERSVAKRAQRKAAAARTEPAVAAPGAGPGTDVPTAPPVDSLPGIGPATATKLAARGIDTLEDLVHLLPAGYRDLRRRDRVDDVEDGCLAVVEGTIASFRQGWGSGRYIATLELQTSDGPRIQARWFHRGGLGSRVETGARLVLVGTLQTFRGRRGFVHPEVYSEADPPPPIAVRYPAVEGVGPRVLAKAVRNALARLPDAPWLLDALPKALAQAQGLPGLREAIGQLHDPDPGLSAEEVAALDEGRTPAHRRLAFEELLLLQLALQRRRAELQGGAPALTLPEDAWDRERLLACLPFTPTGAQDRAIEELARDMAGARPMLRLLQGDVGSGKTAVAFAAALAVAAAGGQTAFMAPTEILAEQHLRTLGPWCEAAGLRLAVLTGQMAKGQRQSLLALMAAGQVDIVVGTHALLVADVHFARLGLVVVDEQHRFGVEQRALLRDKGDRPHLLVMTATPIPRTLALTVYGELDVSVIDELPPGRTPPVTKLYCGTGALPRARKVLAGAVERGSKAFVVCPLVEASEAVDASDVEATATAMRALLPDVEVGLVHGRMSSEDKDEVMARFREGALQVLVATTVIEVGVDVPDARIILVEHAERFGLAQLHQLRGRVGRGGGPCACLLHTAFAPASDVGERLSILGQTHDGFVVAERDLALRGPGEVFGLRQAGMPKLRLSGFGGEGTRLLVEARNAARALLEADPVLAEHPSLRDALSRRLGGEAVRGADAG